MRHQTANSLYHSTVGFDRLFKLLDTMSGMEGEAVSYPPYNIEQFGDNQYRITMAVAGFSEDELTIDLKEQALTIAGEKKAEEKQTQYLHRGIAQRGFKRRFQLADHVEVKNARLADGLLYIDLVRELPESMKPRTIKIENAATNRNDLIEAA